MNPTHISSMHARQHAFSELDLGGVCFISDMHLTEHMPLTLAQFEDFCNTIATRFDTLIVLGDLFEYWIGDDSAPHNTAAERVIKAFTSLHQRGLRIGFIAGNRDFLVREAFCQTAHMTLLPDPCILTINEQNVMLSHGDLMCTLDKSYQIFRRTVHMPWLQNMFLKTPLSWRNALAQRIRAQSIGKKHTQPLRKPSPTISFDKMDVVPDTAAECFKIFDVRYIIHGHTHRPSTHLTFNTTRIVLPDWDCDSPTHRRWGYIDWHAAEPKLVVHSETAHPVQA